MSNYYWLKLHYDLLDDWKVGTLPDSLKWRFIQCLLVAGETNDDGFLPPLAQFAFRIRPMTPEALQKDLAHLASSELVELRIYNDGSERWYVTNYKKRQAKKTAAERKRAQRERDRHAEITPLSRDSHARVTTRDTDKIRIDKIRIDKNAHEPEIIAALSSIARETLAPGFNEEKYDSAIQVLIEREATPEQIKAFGAWWSDNGWHNDRPALANVLDHWQDFLDGKSLKKTNSNKSTAEWQTVLECIKNGTPPADARILQAVKMVGWPKLKTATEREMPHLMRQFNEALNV